MSNIMGLNLQVNDSKINNSANQFDSSADNNDNDFNSVLKSQVKSSNNDNKLAADRQKSSSERNNKSDSLKNDDQHSNADKALFNINNPYILASEINVDIRLTENVSDDQISREIIQIESESIIENKINEDFVAEGEIDVSAELIDDQSILTSNSEDELISEKSQLSSIDLESESNEFQQKIEDMLIQSDIEMQQEADANLSIDKLDPNSIDMAKPEIVKQDSSLLTDIEINTNFANLNVNKLENFSSIELQNSSFTNTKLDLDINSPNWNVAFRAQIQWLIHHNEKGANIQIHPPELGPIQVKLQVKDNKANIIFNTNASDSKEAIDMSLPKLREMLDAQGIELNHTEVNDFSQFQNNDNNAAADETLFTFNQESQAEHSDPVIQNIETSLVNIYA